MFDANLFSAAIYGDENKPGLLKLEDLLQRVEDPSGAIAFWDQFRAKFPSTHPAQSYRLEASVEDHQAWQQAYEKGITELVSYIQEHQPTIIGYRVRVLGDHYRRGGIEFDHLSPAIFDKVEGRGSYQGMMTSGKVPRKIELTGILAKILSTMARGESEKATAERQVITYGKSHKVRHICAGVHDLAIPDREYGVQKQIELAVRNDYLFVPYDAYPEWLQLNLEFIGKKGLAAIKFEIHYHERDKPVVIQAA